MFTHLFLQVSFDKLDENIKTKVVMLRGMDEKKEKVASSRKGSDSECESCDKC